MKLIQVVQQKVYHFVIQLLPLYFVQHPIMESYDSI